MTVLQNNQSLPNAAAPGISALLQNSMCHAGRKVMESNSAKPSLRRDLLGGPGLCSDPCSHAEGGLQSWAGRSQVSAKQPLHTRPHF